jgi:hypothetical protein
VLCAAEKAELAARLAQSEALVEALRTSASGEAVATPAHDAATAQLTTRCKDQEAEIERLQALLKELLLSGVAAGSELLPKVVGCAAEARLDRSSTSRDLGVAPMAY